MAKAKELKKHIIEAFSHKDSEYIEVAEARPLDDQSQGVHSRVRVEYDLNALDRIMKGELDLIVSSVLPPTPTYVDYERWPGFLVDLLPQGHARSFWISRLQIPDNATSDWTLLKYSGKSPIGSIRIQNKDSKYQKRPVKKAFEIKDLSSRSRELLAYLAEQGEPVSSFTGAGGASPKFLLVQAKDGNLYAEGAVPEAEVTDFLLVKFPADDHSTDRDILRAEAAYYRFAERVLEEKQVTARLESDALLLQRFDRIKHEQGHFRRIGVESLYQRLGIAGHGAYVSLLDAADTLMLGVKNKQESLISLLKRDFLNMLLFNTDLHGRNTSFLKIDGVLSLSPPYDLAPMGLSRDGIFRYPLTGWRTKDGHFSFEDTAEDIKWKDLAAYLEARFKKEKISAEKLIAALIRCRRIAEEKQQELIHDLEGNGVSERSIKLLLDEQRKQLDTFDKNTL